MEKVVINPDFWQNRRVFITGHSGFKGSWMALWLTEMGAKVHGYALQPSTNPNLLELIDLENRLAQSTIGDIRDLPELSKALGSAQPSVVVHMAAQPLVRESYRTPVETFSTNVMGTVNLLESVRQTESVEAVVIVTTDKCYQSQDWIRPYRENDRLGGHDPYSSSKACAELVTEAYRSSFLADSRVQVATARAGNVIGGGDWAADRLIPDFLRALDAQETLLVRSPNAVRPWQHVLEPLFGYLLLSERLVEGGNAFAEEWNFGPEDSDARPVSWIVERLCREAVDAKWEIERNSQPHETKVLKLDSAKAKSQLGWHPHWSIETALEKTIDWHAAWKSDQDMLAISLEHITSYLNR